MPLKTFSHDLHLPPDDPSTANHLSRGTAPRLIPERLLIFEPGSAGFYAWTCGRRAYATQPDTMTVIPCLHRIAVTPLWSPVTLGSGDCRLSSTVSAASSPGYDGGGEACSWEAGRLTRHSARC